LEKFLGNLKAIGTIVNPQIKTLPPFGVYYVEVIGSYAQISEYCQKLAGMFEDKGKNFTTLAIFDDPTYQPKQSKIKVAVLANEGMKVKEEYKKVVKYMKFDPGKFITYTHNGSGSLLSLFWKELEKYCKLNDIVVRKNVPDFEIYRQIDPNHTQQLFEIYLPIK
jgi:predicted transcriptional regulator YdeE